MGNKKLSNTFKVTNDNATNVEEGILQQKINRGEYPEYHYPDNHLPKINKKIPFYSPVTALLKSKKS